MERLCRDLFGPIKLTQSRWNKWGRKKDALDISPLFSVILLSHKWFLSPEATDKVDGEEKVAPLI